MGKNHKPLTHKQLQRKRLSEHLQAESERDREFWERMAKADLEPHLIRCRRIFMYDVSEDTWYMKRHISPQVWDDMGIRYKRGEYGEYIALDHKMDGGDAIIVVKLDGPPEERFTDPHYDMVEI